MLSCMPTSFRATDRPGRLSELSVLVSISWSRCPDHVLFAFMLDLSLWISILTRKIRLLQSSAEGIGDTHHGVIELHIIVTNKATVVGKVTHSAISLRNVLIYQIVIGPQEGH